MKRIALALLLTLIVTTVAVGQSVDLGPTIPGNPPCPPVTADEPTSTPDLELKWSVWVGAIFNPEGVGPKLDFGRRWSNDWGVKIGLAFAPVQDVNCTGPALFCSALHGTSVVDYKRTPQPVKSPIEFDTEHDWSVDVMVRIPWTFCKQCR